MLSINISELIWTVVNFFLLYFLLKRFLYDPVVKFTDARRARVEAELDKERAALAQSEENERAIAERISAGRSEAKELVESSRAGDARRSAEAAATAGERAASELEAARRSIESERQRSAAGIRADMDALASELAGSLLGGGE